MAVIPLGSLASANVMSLASLPAPESLAGEKEAAVAGVLGSLTMGHPVLFRLLQHCVLIASALMGTTVPAGWSCSVCLKDQEPVCGVTMFHGTISPSSWHKA